MARFQLYRDAKKEYRWRLIADSGQNIASSGYDGYATKDAALATIEALRGCANTPVVDTTGDSE